MSIRQKIAGHPFASLFVAAVVLALCVIYFLYTMNMGPWHAESGYKAFFTTDDGKTLFADDGVKIPPFDHNGGVAFGARVFTCDGGQHRWVQYLEKYPDDIKRQLDAQDESVKTLPPDIRAGGFAKLILVKKPGSTEWTPSTDAEKFEDIRHPVPPPGMGTGPVEPVLP